jgi:hypothetical protein
MIKYRESHKLFRYLRYSGAVVTFRLNPFHWEWVPKITAEDELLNEKDKVYSFLFLFLLIRVWLDDGQW